MPYRITSFSNFKDEEELGRNTTMWSHYADNHKGFCVKYFTNFNELKHKYAILCGLYKIIYSSVVSKSSPNVLK